MKSVADSPAWKHIDRNIDEEFVREWRHLRMGLSLDGVNPFSMQPQHLAGDGTAIQPLSLARDKEILYLPVSFNFRETVPYL